VVSAASLVFFAFIGFDVVATSAEETKKPQRDLPVGIIASLAICTTLYVLVSIVVTGMVKFNQISVDAPLAEAFRSVGRPGFATLISVGALIGLTTVMMILMMGQSRVFFAMSRDRLLPPVFSTVSPRFGVPVRVQITTGVAIAAIAFFVPLTSLAKLVNIGTLFAFVVVAAGVLVLRYSHPDLPRAFKTPLMPVLPIVSIVASIYLMLNLPAATWLRFLIWMAIGFVVYFVYSQRNSRLRLAEDAGYPAGVGGPTNAVRAGEADPR
jgi:APA family basic amino acid/polyamine antiporter